jgi:hypothetical protein
MTLRSIRTYIDRSPLIVNALRAIVQELNLEEALVIVLILRALTEVVTIVGHQLILTILLTANDIP